MQPYSSQSSRFSDDRYDQANNQGQIETAHPNLISSC
jgi:hypothetical protein